MSSRHFYTVAYAMMVRNSVQHGQSQTELENKLEEIATQNDFLIARHSKKVPESVAREQVALMKRLGGPAPRRDGK